MFISYKIKIYINSVYIIYLIMIYSSGFHFTGEGIAPRPANLRLTVRASGQICFGIDYDFATHTCYFHTTNINR